MTRARVTLLLLLLLLGASLPAQVPLLGDANQDGVVNAADHAFIRAILNGRLPPTTAADIDGDGKITERDAAAVADLILGRAPFLYQGSGTLTPDGGELAVADLNLAAAEGALPATAEIVVTAAARPPPFQGDDDSPLYRIQGLPTRYGEGLTVSLPLTSPGRGPGRADSVVLELGEEVFPPSSAEPYLAMQIIEARIENGRLVADLPPLDLPPPDRGEEVSETHTILVRRVTGVGSELLELPSDEVRMRSGVPLQLRYPRGLDPELYQPVIHAMGRANIRLNQLGFSPADRTRAVVVKLKVLPDGVSGYYVPTARGVDYSWLEINIRYVLDGRLLCMQRTVFHEYFHMIQARFDPRFAYTQAKFIAPTLWFDEASAVWFEKYAPAATGTTSPLFDQHAHELLAGHHMDSSGLAVLYQALATRAQNRGYGLAAMLEFLFSHPDAPPATRGKANPTLVNIYTAIRNRTAMRDAFLDNVPPVTQWWDSMLTAYVDGSIGNPGVFFHSSITQPGAHAQSVRLAPRHKGNDAFLLTAPSLGDCESWAFSINWQDVGARPNRRLIAETAAPDNKLYTTAFFSAGRQNPFADDGQLFGKYGDWYVSWIALPMENTVNGLNIRPMNYLVLRHFEDPPASKAGHKLRIWYVDAEHPVNTTASREFDTRVQPKGVGYSMSGTATCTDALAASETVLYSDAALSQVSSRGGASFTVPPSRPTSVDIDVTLNATIEEDSIYSIERYRLRAYYHDKDGETRVVYLRTYDSPGPSVNIRETIPFGANDRHVNISVQIDEDIDTSQALPNVIYSLASHVYIGTMWSYDNTLKARYETPSSRSTAPSAHATPHEVVRYRNGATTVPDIRIHEAMPGLPAP